MTTRKNNALNGAQKFELATFITNNKNSLLGKTKQKIASEATKSLGFKVTTFNVEYAANISGQDWARTNKTRTPNNTKRNLAWQKFNHEMRALARAHLDICAQLGTKTRNHEYIMKIALRDITESYESHNQ